MAVSPLPAATHIGGVHLKVKDLDRALRFYAEALGFRAVDRNGSTAALSSTGTAPALILLSADSAARPKPRRTSGLYHVAIRFPTRRELARVFARLLAREVRFQGFADHRVSEALYLADPDGNGIELYTDRPRSQWRETDGNILMTTEALDVGGLLAEVEGEEESWKGIHPSTDIGHVHLQCSDLSRAEAFYHDLVGFDVTLRGIPGALFVSAGGYHHHIGLNTWESRGASAPPADAVGLLSFTVAIPERDAWEKTAARLREAGALIEGREGRSTQSVVAADPDRNIVEISYAH